MPHHRSGERLFKTSVTPQGSEAEDKLMSMGFRGWEVKKLRRQYARFARKVGWSSSGSRPGEFYLELQIGEQGVLEEKQ